MSRVLYQSIVLLLLSALSGVALGQSPLRADGQVMTHGGEKVEIFDVRALKSDSTYVTGGTFLDGTFDLFVPQVADLLRISALGYKPLTIPLKAPGPDGELHLGSLVLEEDTKTLEGVVVTSERPLVKLKEGAYVVDVSHTYLAHVGTLLDVIRRVPGAIVSGDGRVSIMGKPRLLIRLNGRDVRSMSELETLQSGQIATISVDRDPSAAFSSDYDAILSITTKSTLADRLLTIAQNGLSVSRRVSDNGSLSLSGQTGPLKYFSTLQLGTNGGLQHDEEAKEITAGSRELQTERHTDLDFRSRSVSASLYGEYEVTKSSLLGAGYRFGYSSTGLVRDQDFRSTLGGITSATPALARTTTVRSEHSPTLYFTSRGDHTFLGIYSDYYHATLKDVQRVTEEGSDALTQDFLDRYDVAGLRGDFSHTLPLLTYTVGAKFSYISDRGTYLDGKTDLPASLMTSRALAAYLNLRKRFGRATVTAGLRYEREHSALTRGEVKEVDRVFSHLFPYLLLSYSGSVSGSLSYTRRIYRPSYSRLILRSSYIDPLSYSIGNPKLRSTLVDIVTLSLQKGGFYGSLSYQHYRDKMVQMPLLEEEAQRIRFSYENVPHAHLLSGYLSYSYGMSKAKWTNSLMLYSGYMAYEERVFRRLDNIGLLLKSTLDLFPWKGSDILLSGTYRNAQQEDFYYHRPSWGISLRASQDLLDGRLRLTLFAEDILKTERPNNWTQRMPYATIRMATDGDTRSVGLSIRYTFGKSKARSASFSSISEETSRL